MSTIQDRAREFVRSRFGKPQKAEAEYLHETASITASAFATLERENAVREFIDELVIAARRDSVDGACEAIFREMFGKDF